MDGLNLSDSYGGRELYALAIKSKPGGEANE